MLSYGLVYRFSYCKCVRLKLCLNVSFLREVGRFLHSSWLGVVAVSTPPHVLSLDLGFLSHVHHIFYTLIILPYT